MTHADKGRYSAKHAPGGKPDEKIAAAVREKVANGKLACADAERIGARLGAALAEVGRTLDLLEVRISRCQLGLFGYDDRREERPAGSAGDSGDRKGHSQPSCRRQAPLRSRLGDRRGDEDPADEDFFRLRDAENQD